jgi:N-acetylglucosamine-6-phosphate deacetylase
MSAFGNEYSRLAVRAERWCDGEVMRHPASLLIADGVVVDVAPAGEAPPGWTVVEPPPGTVMAPGFVDLQVNGGGDRLFNDAPTADTLAVMAGAHRRAGTAAIFATLITDRPERRQAALDLFRDGPPPGVAGLHLEGPFINPRRAGIHPRAFASSPTADDVAAITAVAAHVPVMVTLAPEIVSPAAIATLVAAGVTVALGHSDADAATVLRAVDAGARVVTHLYNAMSQLQARAPGLVGATLADPRLAAGLILDGMHVNPISARAALAVLGPDRLFLVSDAMPTVGGDARRFDLLGTPVTLADGRLTGPDGTLAGAHLALGDALVNAMAMLELPLVTALRLVTATPARVVGIHPRRGAIAVGAIADFVALEPDGRVRDWRLPVSPAE